jgi:hypothetical protein
VLLVGAMTVGGGVQGGGGGAGGYRYSSSDGSFSQGFQRAGAGAGAGAGAALDAAGRPLQGFRLNGVAVENDGEADGGSIAQQLAGLLHDRAHTYGQQQLDDLTALSPQQRGGAAGAAAPVPAMLYLITIGIGRQPPGGAAGGDGGGAEEERAACMAQVVAGPGSLFGRYEVTIDDAERRVTACSFSNEGSSGGASAEAAAGGAGGGEEGEGGGSATLGFRSEAYRDIMWARLRRKKVAYYENIKMEKGARKMMADV